MCVSSSLQTQLHGRSYEEIVDTIDTLPHPPHIHDDSLPEDQVAEDLCVNHVKQQLLQLTPGELSKIIEVFSDLDYAAWTLAGFEGP